MLSLLHLRWLLLLLLLDSCTARKSLAGNVTRLLNRLLTDYNKSLRPTHNSGNATIVLTNININSLGPISNFEMSFSMDCYFRQEWIDRRLAFEDISENPNNNIMQISLSMKMLELIWKPDTYFLNGKESYLHKIPTFNRLVRLFRDGRILYSSRLTIKASCPMDLRDFPLDSQTCPLWIGSFSYSKEEVEYRWKAKNLATNWFPIQIDQGLKLSQFDLLGAEYEDLYYNVSTEKQYIGMNIRLKRHMGYYVLQVYIPCIMLVTLSWVAFFINREATADRSSIGIMCVLSLATLSFDVRNDIPEVPYATAMDWFLMMCYSFVFASLLEFTIVHYFTKVGYGDFRIWHMDTDSDLFSAATAATTSVESSGVMTSPHHYQPYQQQHHHHHHKKSLKNYLMYMWHCIKSDPLFKNQMTRRAHHKGINSVSKCDRIARIVFPTTFCLLNILYWLRYYYEYI